MKAKNKLPKCECCGEEATATHGNDITSDFERPLCKKCDSLFGDALGTDLHKEMEEITLETGLDLSYLAFLHRNGNVNEWIEAKNNAIRLFKLLFLANLIQKKQTPYFDTQKKLQMSVEYKYSYEF